jgi:hypothetical protein
MDNVQHCRICGTFNLYPNKQELKRKWCLRAGSADGTSSRISILAQTFGPDQRLLVPAVRVSARMYYVALVPAYINYDFEQGWPTSGNDVKFDTDSDIICQLLQHDLSIGLLTPAAICQINIQDFTASQRWLLKALSSGILRLVNKPTAPRYTSLASLWFKLNHAENQYETGNKQTICLLVAS